MAAALAHLPEEDRARLVAHEVDGMPVEAFTLPATSTGTARVRLARSRAKLRVEYLLALRGIEPPTTRCRPALLALAGGDRARQQTRRQGAICWSAPPAASLSEPLVERRRGLAVLVPLVAFRRLVHLTRSHPVTSGLAAAAAAGAVAVGVAAATAGSPPPAIPAPSVPPVPATVRAAPPTTPGPPATLTVDGRALPNGGDSLLGFVGHRVVARRAVVVAVATHNGFWVGSAPLARVWVELVGPLRPLRVMVGEHVSFVAPLVAQPAGYAASTGVDAAEGGALLGAEGAHLAVPTTAIVIGS